tara:strand:- start:25560 stop:26135 length:576 start_codon:yes stop_codon:yes gene_type:complete
MIKSIVFKNKTYTITRSVLTAEIKDFIKNVFKTKYNANINYFEESFLVLRNQENQILSVLGLRDYTNKNFLIESYLQKNIQEIIGKNIDPKKILEIGNLSSIEPEGFGSLLIFNSMDYILNTNADYAFITATNRVRNILKKYKIIFEVICPANKNNLENYEQWGNYYEQETNLMKIDLIKTRENLQEKVYE